MDKKQPLLTPAQEKLVVEYMPLAKSLAKKFRGCHGANRLDVHGLTLDDLRSESLLKLTECVRALDPERGKFATLARRAIWRHLCNLIRKRPLPTERFAVGFDPPSGAMGAPGSMEPGRR